MTLREAIGAALDNEGLKISRDGWTHGDSIEIRNQDSYMGGELYWAHSGNRVELFFIDDLMSSDWKAE